MFFERTGSLFRDADLAVGNLETPVAGEALRYTFERYSFNTPDGYVASLKKAGFDLPCLANNHVMDRGEEGIRNTLACCRRLGVDTVGAYATASERDTVCIRSVDGIRVAFLNYTYGTNAFAHHRYLDHKYMVNLFQPEENNSGADWFYWAFCVENANGRTLTFHFEENRLGYFGPAVSRDLRDWTWLGAGEENSFTYTFGKEESCVYFAHHMLYGTDRFNRFARAHALEIKELCKTKKGRSVPCAAFGAGEKAVLFTARHHACESTGNYVLEGVLEHLLSLPEIPFCCIVIPFVDFDGVVDGDQGKGRLPRDHGEDYEDAPLHAETAAIMRLVREQDVLFGCDFHSPWHKGRGERHLLYGV